MSNKGNIGVLLAETENAKAWLDKLTCDLASDPSNETVRRLLHLTKELYERRVQLLAEMGVAANDRITGSHGSFDDVVEKCGELPD